MEKQATGTDKEGGRGGGGEEREKGRSVRCVKERDGDCGRGRRLPQQTGLRLVCQSVRMPAEILGDRVTTRFLLKRKGGQDRAVQDQRSWRTSF